MIRWVICSISMVFNFISEAQTKPIIDWVTIKSDSAYVGTPDGEKDRGTIEYYQKLFFSEFKISKYEITFEQFDLFCDATGRVKPNDSGWGRGNRPVINISWNDANAFAEWMGCRLPLKEEWEYACRAGTNSPFNTGDSLRPEQANFNCTNSYSNCSFKNSTTPVGSYPPNKWGLYDMHGNVSEWCGDPKKLGWEGLPATTPAAFYMGGSWGSDMKYCRSAGIGNLKKRMWSNGIGFRLVAK